jgi:hypothetical protein
MPSVKPAPNVAAAAIAGAVAGVSQHFVVKYGIDISPDTQDAITGVVMIGVAHLWDMVTGQNVPAPTQGQAPPPPIAPPVVK